MTKRATIVAALSAAVLSASADLPDAYRRLTYVEATGSQWVLTDYVPKGNSCITAGMSFSDLSENQAVFCARGSNANVNSTTIFWIKDNGLRWDYGASKATGPVPVHYEPVDVNTPLTINCRMNEFWLNSEKSTISKEAAQDYTADNNLVLFASHSQAKGTDLSKLSSSAFSAYAKMRLYSLTASEGSEVKLDLIPCQRKADSKIGLYDLVKGLFLEPVGGDLQGGDGMALLPADDFKPVNLPSEFSQLSCVQATGSQWVVTGCVPTGNADIDAEVSFASLKEMQALLCARGSESTINSTTLLWIFGNVRFGAAEVGFRWDYGATGAVNLAPNSRCDEGSVKENTRIKIASRKNEFYIDDRMSWISKASPSDYTADNPLVLFAAYTQPKGTKLEDLGDAAFTAKANVWLYSFKVSNGASAVMDLIPCRRTQDGKVGLYDMVGGTFLEPRGGELIAGPEAVEPATTLWIESDGGAPASMPRLGKYAVLGEGGQVVVTASSAEVENSIITPISWKLTVTDSEGVVHELRSDVSNGQRCAYSPKTGDHAVLTWHCVKTAKVAKDGLPPGYSSLPYVEATGTQCIVTDFTPKGSSCVDADFALMSTTEAQWIFCARGTGSVDSFGLCYVNNSGNYGGEKVERIGFRWDYRDVDANRLSREFGIQSGEIVACRSDRNELHLNSYLSKASGTEPLEFVAGNRLVLFAGYAVSAPAEPTGFSSYAKLRLYSFVVREEGVTKLSLVPCVRNSDSVVGLYDTVAGKFHEPQGGALVAGRMGEDELEVTGVKAEYGAPSLPYGITTGLAAGDSFVCSAPKKVEKADGGWISCLCYDLQSNDVNRVSYPWKKGAGNSFVYEHQADAGARLVWRWGTPGLMLILK